MAFPLQVRKAFHCSRGGKVELVVRHPQESDADPGETGRGHQQASSLTDVVRNERVRGPTEGDGDPYPSGDVPAST
jgi:hypothetical protein